MIIEKAYAKFCKIYVHNGKHFNCDYESIDRGYFLDAIMHISNFHYTYFSNCIEKNHPKKLEMLEALQKLREY